MAVAAWSAVGPATADAAWEPAAEVREIATLLRPHNAFVRPDATSPSIRRVAARRPITRIRTALPVLARAVGRDGRAWLRVPLPGRPNGRTGWIAQTGTTGSRTPWHLLVEVRRRRVVAFRAGRRVRSFRVIVGKPSTPTPRGEFFVEERVRLHPSGAGAPFALAASARSEVLQEFAGGPGQIALHGVRNIGGRLGTAVSHGCIRLSTRAISWLFRRVRAGTPLTVR